MLKRSSTLAWIAFAIVLLAVLFAPTERSFPAAILSSFVFAAALTWLPMCRPVTETPLCPWNWAVLLFGVQLVAMPLLITLDGAAPGLLPSLPSLLAINMALVYYSLAFLTVAVVYNHFGRLRAYDGQRLDRLRRAADTEVGGSIALIGFFSLAGGAGVLLSLGSFGGILDYFSNPVYYQGLYLDASTTWRGLGAMLLKPFLGFAVIMAWCRWHDSGGKKSSWMVRAFAMILLLAGIVVTFSMLNFNRGSIAVPLLAVATTAVVTGDKISRRIMAMAAVLGLGLMPLYVLYRSGTELAGNSQTSFSDVVRDQVDISEVAQMYGGAPQFLGFLLERSHWGSDPRWGEATVCSALSPVPILGKLFRQNSGFAIYNRMIYGTDAIVDQNVPFQGESFMDFHIVGVLFGSALFGWVLHRLQRAFERSRSSIDVYVWQYLSVWVCFLIFGFGGVVVQSQVLIYSCWPIYAFWFSKRMARWPSRLRATATQGA